MQYRAVIFDLDGTLYDSRCFKRLLFLAETVTFRLGNLGRERAARRQLQGQEFDTTEQFYQTLYTAISRHNPAGAEQWYLHHYLPLQTQILRRFCKADAWVKPRLQELRQQGIKTVLYSDYSYTEPKLQALGLDPAIFDLIVDAPSLGGLKPCQRSAQRLLQQIGVEPHEALFVGDRVDCDIRSAQKVGAHFQLLQRNGSEVRFCPPDELPTSHKP